MKEEKEEVKLEVWEGGIGWQEDGERLEETTKKERQKRDSKWKEMGNTKMIRVGEGAGSGKGVKGGTVKGCEVLEGGRIERD